MKSIFKVLFLSLVLALFSISAFGQQALYNSLNKRLAILYKNGKTMQAIDTGKEALKVAEETFGKDHAYYCSSLENLALLYVSEGINDKAAGLYEESFSLREKLLGKNHPSLKKILEKLETCYRRMNKDAKVADVMSRMADLRSE